MKRRKIKAFRGNSNFIVLYTEPGDEKNDVGGGKGEVGSLGMGIGRGETLDYKRQT